MPKTVDDYISETVAMSLYDIIIKYTICQTQHSPCTGLLCLTPRSTENFTIRTHVRKYLKIHQNTNVCIKYNNVVHLYRLGNRLPSTQFSIALHTLSTVSLSFCLPLYTHLFLS